MINIAEILKDCPKGTKLYSPLCGECTLHSVIDNYIKVEDKEEYIRGFLSNGKITLYGECQLFPSKENRDWSTFKRSFKDGDVIYNPGIKAISILKSNDSEKSISYAFLNILSNLHVYHYHSSDLSDWRLATEEEKAKLFKAIKDNGYKWNEETKTLEKLIEPKFKVGDKVRHKTNHSVVFTIDGIEEDFYTCTGKMALCFGEQDSYELVPNKFDITTLKPFESRVLVRDSVNSIHEYGEEYNDVWRPAIWGVYVKDSLCPFGVQGGCYFNYCIPYDGNEHLLGKTDDCDEYYKTWE